MNTRELIETTLASVEDAKGILSAIDTAKERDEWDGELAAYVRERLDVLFEECPITTQRASHWTNSNYTKLIDPFSVAFSGERLPTIVDQDAFGHGFARTLRILSGSRWDKKLGVRAASQIAEMEILSELQGLEVAEQKFGPKGVARFASSPHLTNLRALSFTGSKSGVEGAEAIAANPALANLEILILSQGRVESAGVEALAKSPYLTKLRVLVLDENKLGAAAFEHLAASETLAGLEYLSVNSNKDVGASGVEALAASETLRSLRTLHVNNVGMRAAGAKALAASEIARTLVLLDARGGGNNLSDKAARVFDESELLEGCEIRY